MDDDDDDCTGVDEACELGPDKRLGVGMRISLLSGSCCELRVKTDFENTNTIKEHCSQDISLLCLRQHCNQHTALHIPFKLEIWPETICASKLVLLGTITWFTCAHCSTLRFT